MASFDRRNHRSDNPTGVITDHSILGHARPDLKSTLLQILTVRVPMRLHKRGGRKVVLTPASANAWAPRNTSPATAILKAIVRAHRWTKLLERGEYATLAELARAEKINPSYLCRLIRLTLLAPEIVEAVLSGQTALELKDLMKPFPVEWKRQKRDLTKVHENARITCSPSPE
jgi:hypothetical protein